MYVHPVDFYPDQQFRVDPKSCFVIMPFSEEWSQRIYEVLQDCVGRAGYDCRRGDDYFGRVVLVDVWQRLNQASFVLADLTAENPNVYYELGIAHTLGKEIIPILQRGSNIPFDQQPFRVLMYENSTAGLAHLREALPRWIESLDYNSSPQSMLLRGHVSRFNDWRAAHQTFDLTNSDFSGLDLSGINLGGAIMRAANLHHARLDDANLSKAVLTSCRFTEASLKRISGAGLHASEADFSGADLSHGFLASAVMIRTNFGDSLARGVKLGAANLSESSLVNADFAEADLRDGILVRARLDGANLSGASIAGAVVDRSTYVRYASIFEQSVDVDGIVVED